MNIKFNEWILDFKKRLDQFSKLVSQQEYRMKKKKFYLFLNFKILLKKIEKKGVWMGGLLFPEAYLTATRQYVAQNHLWSLEELELKVKS